MPGQKIGKVRTVICMKTGSWKRSQL